MAKFKSTKLFDGYSTCFRQWRADGTHCKFLHGYAVSFRVWFEGDLDCNLPWEGDKVAYARTDCGWGCEFDDSVSVEWEFSNDITELEQQELKELYLCILGLKLLEF